MDSKYFLGDNQNEKLGSCGTLDLSGFIGNNSFTL
jgi:hypothetical protein